METITSRNSTGYESPIGLAADAVVFTVRDGGLAVLLSTRRDEPYGRALALPGGFVGADETPEQTVARKLEEKTGMAPVHFEQLGTYADPGRDPRGWLPSVAYLALVPDALLPPQDGTNAAWHDLASLDLRLPFDHGRMIADGQERLRGKLWYSNIAYALLPSRFTMTEARRVYEAISGRGHSAGNFARDLERSGLVRKAGGQSHPPRGRPAALYEFVSGAFAWSRRPA
jgi:8-oxo-dGTP diphosphatase